MQLSTSGPTLVSIVEDHPLFRIALATVIAVKRSAPRPPSNR